VFLDNMQYVIFRPYGTACEHPERRVAAKLTKDPAYLAKNDYEVVDSHNKVVPRSRAPEVLAPAPLEKLSIRQVPGQKNALGFVSSSSRRYDVYLHGTPARGLFSRARRDFSHGCIRVEKPEQLALWVLRDQPRWTLDRIRKAATGTAPLQVGLNQPIPVLIVYATAAVKETAKCASLKTSTATTHRSTRRWPKAIRTLIGRQPVRWVAHVRVSEAVRRLCVPIQCNT